MNQIKYLQSNGWRIASTSDGVRWAKSGVGASVSQKDAVKFQKAVEKEMGK